MRPTRAPRYECIHTVTLALPFTKKADGSDSKNVPQVVTLCSEILKSFVEDPDQNLKYLGLVRPPPAKRGVAWRGVAWRC